MEWSCQGDVSFDDTDKFQRLLRTVSRNRKQLSKNISLMSDMVKYCQTHQYSHELRYQLRQIQNYTHKLVNDIYSTIMEMMQMKAGTSDYSLTRNPLRNENIATFLSTQRSEAQDTNEDVRKVIEQNINIGDPFDLGGGSRDSVELESIRKHDQISAQSERELQQLEEWERDTRLLESDILKVNQIIEDLGSIIHEQGVVEVQGVEGVVESIEASEEVTAHDVEAVAHDLLNALRL